jgi:hypothetical protein
MSPPIDWKKGEGARRSSSSSSGLASSHPPRRRKAPRRCVVGRACGEYTGGREEVEWRAHEHETILLPDRGGGEEKKRGGEAMINGGESQSRWVGGSFAAVSSTHHGRRVGVQALLYSAGSANAHAFHMIPYYITHVPFLYGTCSLHSRCG